MKNNKSKMRRNRGFTLIELLVVVLIIGILAAVALPQYQKAVAKARAVQMLQIATDIRKAEEIYFLENGKYTTALENLSISYVIPSQVRITIALQNQTNPDAVGVFDDRFPGIFFYFGFYHTTFRNWAGRRSCYASKTNENANLLCTQLTGGRKTDSGGGWWVYFFNN